MEHRVDFNNAKGNLLTLHTSFLPNTKVGDTITLFDEDVECDCKVVGKVTKEHGSVFLIMVPTAEQRGLL